MLQGKTEMSFDYAKIKDAEARRKLAPAVQERGFHFTQ